MASFCKKCQTGTSSRTHRTECLKRATAVNVADDWEAMRKLLARTTESIIRLEKTVNLLAGAMCGETKRNVAFAHLRAARKESTDT